MCSVTKVEGSTQQPTSLALTWECSPPCCCACLPGVDYWLIRNSWSKLWGQDGYMKITRKVSLNRRHSLAICCFSAGTSSEPAMPFRTLLLQGNDCGITTGAMLAVPDAEAVARTRAGLTRSSVQV